MRRIVFLIAVVTSFSGLLHAAIPSAERQALIDLYNNTGGASWTYDTNWRNAGDTDFNVAGTECAWMGVTCTGDTVTEISLFNNGLSGTLPSSLQNLPNLTIMNLGANPGLSGSIPSEFGTLLQLVNLEIGYGGNLTGSIPSELGNLSNLETLDLSDNQLDQGIPTTLGGLSNLQYLNLAGNQLSGNIPTELGNLSNLQSLYLGYNGLDGGIPTQLGALSNLQILNLHTNQLSGGIPTQLSSLGNLINLDLSDNPLGGSIPVALASLTKLQSLYLYSDQLSGSIPTELSTLAQLIGLGLSDNQLTGAIPSAFGGFPVLRYLYLDRNQLDGSIPPELGSLALLQRFSLSDNQLSGRLPTEIGSLGNLRTLYLNGNELGGSIPATLGNLSALQYLSLSGNQLSGSIPSELGNLSTLYDDTGLDLRWNALHSVDSGLITFLNTKQNGGDWQSSQTIAPINLSVASTGDHRVVLNWDQVAYTTVEGGYEIYAKETMSPIWILQLWTGSKTTTNVPVSGLTEGTQYDFALKTFTDTHVSNQNRVFSDLSTTLTATTANTGCVAPVITQSGTGPFNLSVTGSYDSYSWSTGESTQGISVFPTESTWYWATTTAAGPCEESAAIMVDPSPIFSDGFESGGTTAWSSWAP